MVYHQNSGRLPGGWLSVSLFFTLSGFLIGGIALAEGETNEKIDILGFWARRIRRLLPASCVALLIAVAVIFINDVGGSRAVLGDIRFAILQVANWRFIGTDSPYAGLDSAPSPIQHYWTLAIEEQFYMVFPVLMAFLVKRRKVLVPILLAIVAVGAVLQLIIDNQNRIYFGTDTRAPEIAIGILLAVAVPYIRPWCERHPRAVDGIGLLGFLLTFGLYLSVPLYGGFVSSGLLSIVAVVWCMLIVAGIWGRTAPRLMSIKPGPWIGKVSYGMYLYHWPIFLVVTETRTGLSGGPLFAVRVALSVAAAAVSAWLIENPIRYGRLPQPRTFRLAGAGVVGVLLLTVAVPLVRSDGTSALASGSFHTPPERVILTTTTTTSASPSTAAPSTMAPSAEPGQAPPETRPPADAATPVSAAPPEAPTATRVPRILVSGDSTASAVGLPIQKVATEDGLAEVFVRTMPGCTFLPYERAQIRPGYIYDPECPDIAGETIALVEQHDIDVVVLFIGTPQLMDFELRGLQGWRSILEDQVATRYTEAVTAQMDRLSALGVPVLWADVALPMWDLDAFGQLFGQAAPGHGPAVTNEPRRTERLNAIDARVAAATVNVARLDYAAALEAAGGLVPSGNRTDGVHPDPDFAAELARSTLFDMMEKAYRDLWTRPDARLASDDPTSTWDVPA